MMSSDRWLSLPLDTVAQREDALRNTLGSMAIEGFVLDPVSRALWDRWVQGEMTLEQAGSLFDDLIYEGCPEARI